MSCSSRVLSHPHLLLVIHLILTILVSPALPTTSSSDTRLSKVETSLSSGRLQEAALSLLELADEVDANHFDEAPIMQDVSARLRLIAKMANNSGWLTVGTAGPIELAGFDDISPLLPVRIAEALIIISKNSAELLSVRNIVELAASRAHALGNRDDEVSKYIAKMKEAIEARLYTDVPTTSSNNWRDVYGCEASQTWEGMQLPPAIEIDRRSNLSLWDFYHEYAMKRVPVVITDYAKRIERGRWGEGWPNDSYLERECGGFPFAVRKRAHRSSGEWAGLEGATFPYSSAADGDGQDISLSNFLQFMRSLDHQRPGSSGSANTDPVGYYIHDEAIIRRCPNLLMDFAVPKYFANDFLQRLPRFVAGGDGRGDKKLPSIKYREAWPSIFVGPRGSSSALHVDSFASHFFMYLIAGRKHWRLFPRAADKGAFRPKQAGFLIDPLCPGAAPEAAAALENLRATQPYDAVLRPGDVIFVPSETPHQVINLGEHETKTTTVLFFENLTLLSRRMPLPLHALG
jgi:hypothetical protein